MSGNVNQRPNVLNLADRTSLPSKKVIRAPMTKKRSKGVPLSERVTLERVLGLTVRDNRSFACNPTTGLVVYPAGCVIVLFNPKRNKQSHIINHSRKTITALAISSDGKNIVSGEYGHKPAVRVWDVEEKCQLAEYHGHKFGINCVAFSPNMKYVVSVGEHHDMVVNVWNLKDGSKHAAGKISVKVTGLSFSEDGSRFVTAGNRSIKFWYMGNKTKTRETLPLNSRSGILGEQRNNFFCSVACGLGTNQSKTYAVTKSGLLCEFNEQRLLDKWVELRTSSAFCIVPCEENLFVGCADGIVRLFNASSLNFVASLPRPHSLGVNVSVGIDPSHMITHQENAKYPAAIAITYDDITKKITCVYSDHSMYVWDVHDVKKIGKQRSYLYHSSCIWGAEVYPSLTDRSQEALPPGCFLTFASDDTIRIWNIDPAMNTDTFKRNIYSNELLKIIYVDDQFEHLCNAESNTASADKTDNTEGKNGIRCVSISTDGQFLASGDRSGNVRIHDMQFMDEMHKIEAHDSEVLCLEFSKPESGHYLLSSASRDRLIHVFNMQDDCSLMQTLDDHSSSITSVKFTQSNGRLQMISCGADKALMFRVVTQNPDFELVRNHHVVGKTTMYDLAVDPTEKYVAVACQDRNIRIHNTVTGKLKRTYKGSAGEDGTLIKVELDPSGMYIATSCSDKSVAIFDFYSGECVATMDGHSELVTGIKFTNDCKHLISTSGDGCIFVWKLPWGFTHNMKERMAEMGQHMKETPTYPQLRRGTYDVVPALGADSKIITNEHRNSNNSRAALSNVGSLNIAMGTEMIEEQDDKEDGDDDPDWGIELGLHGTANLPLWAKKQVCGEDLPSPTTYSNPAQPRGRWAQRLDSKGFKVKSEWDAHRDIELKLQDGIDRRRYTVEPENLAEQSAVAETERLQTSLHISEADDFVPAEEGLASLQAGVSNPMLAGFVTSSRGSDPFLPPNGHSSSTLSPETPDEEEEEEEEELGLGKEGEQGDDEEEEAVEVIIYPPSEESNSSPESLKFQVTESTSSLEELQRRRARSIIKKESPRSSRVIEDADLNKVAEGAESTEPVSLGTSEDEDEDEDEDDDEDEVDNEASEEIQEPDTKDETSPEGDPTSSVPSSNTTTNSTSADASGQSSSSPDRDPEDDESFLHTNYGFTEQEKFGKCLEQLQSGFASVGMNGGNNHHRLSISSKFLSRSQLSHIRGLGASTNTMPASTVGGITAQVYLQRRKDVMAKAVDETRRRLQSMGWNTLRSKSSSNTSSSSASSTTTTTTPISMPTSPKTSVETTVPPSSASEVCLKNETVPRETESSGSNKNSLDVTENPQEAEGDSAKVAEKKESTDCLEDQKGVGDSKDKADVIKALDAKADASAKLPTEESGSDGHEGCKDRPEMVDSRESDSTTDDIPTDKPDAETEIRGEVEANAAEDGAVEDSQTNNPTEISNSAPTIQNSEVASPEDHSCSVVSSADPVHLPIIKGKRPGTAPGELNLEANKENLDRSSKYDPHHGRRSISSSSRSKMERMKARKEAPTPGMRKTTSMTDLSEAKLDGESRSESPSFNMVLRSHPRSHSVERKRIQANSSAREKHRARPERVLPLVPGLLKPKSYEVGTTSSRAKVSSRKDETPPSSPSRTTRSKKPPSGASSEGTKQPKSEGSSPGTPPEPVDNFIPVEQQSAKEALANKTKDHIDLGITPQETVTKEQPFSFKDLRRSSSPSPLNPVAAQKDPEQDEKKVQADKLAMPPPSSTAIAKSSRGLRGSSATRAELRQQRRRGSSTKTLPVTNDSSSTEDPKGSSESLSTSEISQTDARPSSPRGRSSSYRENRSSSLRESLSPKPVRKAPKVEAKPESQTNQNRPMRVKNQNDEAKDENSGKPKPKRRRRERHEDMESNISNNNNSADIPSQDSLTLPADETDSPRSNNHRRRSSETSDSVESPPVTSRLGGEDKEAETEGRSGRTDPEGTSFEQSQSPTIKVPSPGVHEEPAALTFDTMKATVDSMKTAFDQCLELCGKAQEGKSYQTFLDYFAATFSRMQDASSSALSASRQRQRHLNPSMTDDTLSDISESSLPYDDLLRSSSSGIPSVRQSRVPSSDVDALRSSLTSCGKSPPNGMTGDRETTSAIALLDQYSNILVSLVRQKIEDEVSESSAVTQTQRSLESAL